MGTDYRAKAAGMYDPSYQAKVAAAKNSLASGLQSLDNQKVGVNTTFDKQVDNQNLQNTLGKNNFSNTMLGRGLGRSTIASTGLAGMDSANERRVGDINAERTGALNNIDSQKSQLQMNNDNTLTALAGDKETAINNLANQLEQQDWDKDFKTRQSDREEAFRQKQLANQLAAQGWEQQFKERQLSMEQQYKNAELAAQNQRYASKEKDTSVNDMYNAYYEARDKGEGDQFLQQYGPEIRSRYGIKAFDDLMNRHGAWKDQSNKEAKANAAAQRKANQGNNQDSSGSDDVGFLTHLKRFFTPGDGLWW